MHQLPPDQLLYRPEAAAHALDVGRSTIFELISAGHLESVQIGRSRRITRAALEAYVQRLAAMGSTPKDDEDRTSLDAGHCPTPTGMRP